MRKLYLIFAMIIVGVGFVFGCSSDNGDENNTEATEENGDETNAETNNDNGGETSSQTIDENGGVVESASGAARLDFPQGAVDGSAEVTIEQQERPERDDLFTDLYRFEIDAELQQSVEIEIDLTDDHQGADIKLGRYDDGDVEIIGFSGLTNGAVGGLVDEFSSFGGFSEELDIPDIEEETTVIDTGGGVAFSHDGKFQVDFPAGAVGEETEVAIIAVPPAEEGTWGSLDPYLASDVYSVMVMSANREELVELNEAATVAIELDRDVGDADAYVLKRTNIRSKPQSGSQVVDGSVLADIVSLEAAHTPRHYGALLVEMTDRCAATDHLGQSCTEDEGDDCIQDGDFYCVCDDGEREVLAAPDSGAYCLRDESCGSRPIFTCGGINGPLYEEGFCGDDFFDNEHLGAWTGDCYYDE